MRGKGNAQKRGKTREHTDSTRAACKRGFEFQFFKGRILGCTGSEELGEESRLAGERY